jgi:hypothetical protein
MDNGSQTSSDRWATALALVAANLLPLVGVLALGWDVASLLFVYWLESTVVGFFNVLRMAQAQGPVGNPRSRRSGLGQLPADVSRPSEGTPDPLTLPGSALSPSLASKVVLIPFFLVHYGIFMAVHLAFLLSVFGRPVIPAIELGLTAAALFASHGFSYVTYYLLRGENLHASPASEMPRPYGRIVVMHLTLLLGAFLATRWGSPTAALVVMVGVKILIDLLTHTRFHARRSLAWTTST